MLDVIQQLLAGIGPVSPVGGGGFQLSAIAPWQKTELLHMVLPGRRYSLSSLLGHNSAWHFHPHLLFPWNTCLHSQQTIPCCIENPSITSRLHSLL